MDNDPIVLAHARALLTGSPEGATTYIDADLQDPEKIIAKASRTLNFTEPVAITLIAILHHIASYEQARKIVDRLMRAVPPGSYLVISHSTNVINGALPMRRSRGGTSSASHRSSCAALIRSPVLRRPGIARARRGIHHTVAARTCGHRRRTTGSRPVLRRRPQALTCRRPAVPAKRHDRSAPSWSCLSSPTRLSVRRFAVVVEVMVGDLSNYVPRFRTARPVRAAGQMEGGLSAPAMNAATM